MEGLVVGILKPDKLSWVICCKSWSSCSNFCCWICWNCCFCWLIFWCNFFVAVIAAVIIVVVVVDTLVYLVAAVVVKVVVDTLPYTYSDDWQEFMNWIINKSFWQVLDEQAWVWRFGLMLPFNRKTLIWLIIWHLRLQANLAQFCYRINFLNEFMYVYNY